MDVPLRQEEWNSVYYDGKNGIYCMVTIHEDGVSLCDPFTGDSFHHMTGAEFEDATDDFLEINGETLRDPEETIMEVLIAAQSAIDGYPSELLRFDAIEVQFASRAVTLSAEDAAYQQKID